jgi:quercetin 2,3-dioxygenase
MNVQSKGKIYLSSERGLTETPWFRSYNTFNFGRFQSQHKQPFGPLYVLNDDTLGEEQSISIMVEEASLVIILPVVGAVLYKDTTGRETIVQAGQAQFVELAKGSCFWLLNPYEDELINVIHFWIRLPMSRNNKEETLQRFNIDLEKNQWVELQDSRKAKTCIAKVAGRQELTYHVKEKGNGLFIFIIEGAFEVQNVLLEDRDALALADAEELELEALSNDAIIVLIELPMDRRRKVK